jgi:hypothetical protein
MGSDEPWGDDLGQVDAGTAPGVGWGRSARLDGTRISHTCPPLAAGPLYTRSEYSRMSFLFGSLAWTQILMNGQCECWIVKPPIPPHDTKQETVADGVPWAIPDVAKFSIPMLNFSIGPVPGNRGS